MSFWRTKDFKVLAKAWDNKLEQTGFKDAEIELKTGRALKQRATNSYRQATELERTARLEYYCFLGYLVNNTIFPNALEKYVMTRHSEGASIQEIVNEINNGGISRHRRTIGFIIRRWQSKWGIRVWSLKQMKLEK